MKKEFSVVHAICMQTVAMRFSIKMAEYGDTRAASEWLATMIYHTAELYLHEGGPARKGE